MNKFLKIIFGLTFALLALYMIGNFLLNNGSKTPVNDVWSTHIGRDTTVGILPDEYANYYSYTVALTRKDVGFKIKGKFPDTRYFSFNVYSLGDNTTQGSIVDYQIETDSGKPNPFIAHRDSVDTGSDYTVNIVPSKYQDVALKNLLPFRDDVRLLTMVIRLYDYNIDDFGGVELPTVEAFRINNKKTNNKDNSTTFTPIKAPTALSLKTIVRNVSLPKMVERLSHLYKTENTKQLDASDSEHQYYTTPFHAIDTKGIIENNDNRYLLSAITKKDNEVYVFRFKAPNYTTGPENINQTEVRYWSFNLGNAATYNFNALKDEDAILDDEGYVNILLAHKDAVLEKRAADLGYNYLEWNMPWQKALILFRHMLANPSFEAQIDDVPPIHEDMTDFDKVEAQHYMGDYAPQGVRMSKDEFLENYGVTQMEEGQK